MNPDRWGLIYCPTEGNWWRRRRWQHIRLHLEQLRQPFDFVQSEGSGSVERLAAMFTTNGYRTIIVVGGDAALNEALNGIVSATPPGQAYPRLGIIPNGMLNSFAHYWGFSRSTPEVTIDILRRGKTRRIDIGKAYLTTINREVIERSFLNCINIGLTASIIKHRRQSHHFWWGIGGLRELSSAFLLLIHRHSTQMQILIDGQRIKQRFTTLCIGSCTGYGQTPSAVPYSGWLDISAVSRPRLLRVFTALFLLWRHRFLSQQGISVWRTRRIDIRRIGHVAVSIDGRALHRHITQIRAEIRPEALDFIIP